MSHKSSPDENHVQVLCAIMDRLRELGFEVAAVPLVADDGEMRKFAERLRRCEFAACGALFYAYRKDQPCCSIRCNNARWARIYYAAHKGDAA